MQELWDVVAKLLRGEKLDENYLAHQLHGNRKGLWECHIQPDRLLVWEQNEQNMLWFYLHKYDKESTNA